MSSTGRNKLPLRLAVGLARRLGDSTVRRRRNSQPSGYISRLEDFWQLVHHDAVRGRLQLQPQQHFIDITDLHCGWYKCILCFWLQQLYNWSANTEPVPHQVGNLEIYTYDDDHEWLSWHYRYGGSDWRADLYSGSGPSAVQAAVNLGVRSDTDLPNNPPRTIIPSLIMYIFCIPAKLDYVWYTNSF